MSEIRDQNPAIELLMTGNELMSGDTLDSNSSRIAQDFAKLNLRVRRKITVGDDPTLICEAIASAAEHADVLIINGGLGPTSDDLTAALVAQVAGVELIELPEARQHVEQWCSQRGITANHANLKQAWLPHTADIVANPIGSAVGFALTFKDCLIITTPGVPSELTAMLPEVNRRVAAKVGAQSGNILRLQTFGIGESTLQALIDEQIPDWPAAVELGFRAGAPQLEIKLSIREHAHQHLQRSCYSQLQKLFGDHILGEGDTTLASALLAALKAQNKTATAAESCTGGLIASMITREPGASQGFHGSIVAYENTLKSELLGVSKDSLNNHGAVSEPVVREMLAGALARTQANIGVAVSGIAGPTGGSAEKPVGTVWLAWGTALEVNTRCLHIPVGRAMFQTMVAAAGLDLMRRQLLGLPMVPHYFERRAL